MFDDAEISVTLSQISLVFGMSKQTVVKDNETLGKMQLVRLTDAEFMEFIGRITAVIFNKTQMAELPLDQKLNYIMDDLFVLFNGKRVVQAYENDDTSASEEESDFA